jgi:SagB-type dehydrogenase family enzyme
MIWRQYHELTRHSVESLRRSPHYLDWANQPDPFRHYEGTPVLDLPADPPTPQSPALDVLHGVAGSTSAPDGPTFLSQLFFHSAAISASKRIPSTGGRYALRVNPSSGNLHPTEFHFFTRGLREWPDGLYHYRPSAHMAEQRASSLRLPDTAAPLIFVLTTIAWREAWKYRDRAYRYCLHDLGHAWQALALAAKALGCDARAVGCFVDEDVARLCRLPEDEWPMLLMEITGAVPSGPASVGEPIWHGGQPNQLSTELIHYPSIEAIHRATSANAPTGHAVAPAATGKGEVHLPAPAGSNRPFGDVVRGRRSALDFIGGPRTISMPQLSALLSAACQPLTADFSCGFIQLYLYVHRVDSLSPGVYRYWPEHAELELIQSGDQRVAAAGLSLGQQLAGNACVAFSMIADLERATAAYSDRGYRYVHFEAGAIGHRLYLAAESLGLRATGIGAFYDDQVHQYLNLAGDQRQVVYHFSIGYPVEDPRLPA